MLTSYKGTLLIVSHDRDFLDQTVNKILYFNGKGKLSIFMGGYSDFLKSQGNKKELKSFINKKDVIKNTTENIKNKLSFKFKYELENLPKDIEDIQLKINHINDELKNSNLYLDDVERFNSITKEIVDLKESLLVKEDRWLNLLEMEEKIE
jgi:ATP-binding cassette subfamily F protein uup